MGEAGAKTCIDHLFRSLTANRFLEDKITGAILGEEEIADAASPGAGRHPPAHPGRRGQGAGYPATSSSPPTSPSTCRESIITHARRPVCGAGEVGAQKRHPRPGPRRVRLRRPPSSSSPWGWSRPTTSSGSSRPRRRRRSSASWPSCPPSAPAHREDIGQDYDLLVILDGIFARAKLSYRMEGHPSPQLGGRGHRPAKGPPPPAGPGQGGAQRPVAGGDFDTLVITGPNTGGKTVTLKTMGLLTLMAQCGLHIPAGDGSGVAVFDQVLADIGDEQSIDQSLSTFSSHMTNIVGILEAGGRAHPHPLRRAGGGHRPGGGRGPGRRHHRAPPGSMGALVAATTHYAELKVYAMTTPGVENASCEFDVETLAPTYRLLIGVPGKSNAFAISQRLGLPEDIIEKAARAHRRARTSALRTCSPSWSSSARRWSRRSRTAARLRREMEEPPGQAREYRAQMEEERGQGGGEGPGGGQGHPGRGPGHQPTPGLRGARRDAPPPAQEEALAWTTTTSGPACAAASTRRRTPLGARQEEPRARPPPGPPGRGTRWSC